MNLPDAGSIRCFTWLVMTRDLDPYITGIRCNGRDSE